jgi:glycine C-acetyltransferase
VQARSFDRTVFAVGFVIRIGDEGTRRSPPGEQPIVPIMLGDAVLAARMADIFLDRGIYVVGLSCPIVPKGKARIRVQVSAAHTTEDLEFAMEAFSAVKAELGV